MQFCFPCKVFLARLPFPAANATAGKEVVDLSTHGRFVRDEGRMDEAFPGTSILRGRSKFIDAMGVKGIKGRDMLNPERLCMVRSMLLYQVNKDTRGH